MAEFPHRKAPTGSASRHDDEEEEFPPRVALDDIRRKQEHLSSVRAFLSRHVRRTGSQTVSGQVHETTVSTVSCIVDPPATAPRETAGQGFPSTAAVPLCSMPSAQVPARIPARIPDSVGAAASGPGVPSAGSLAPLALEPSPESAPRPGAPARRGGGLAFRAAIAAAGLVAVVMAVLGFFDAWGARPVPRPAAERQPFDRVRKAATEAARHQAAQVAPLDALSERPTIPSAAAPGIPEAAYSSALTMAMDIAASEARRRCLLDDRVHPALRVYVTITPNGGVDSVATDDSSTTSFAAAVCVERVFAHMTVPGYRGDRQTVARWISAP